MKQVKVVEGSAEVVYLVVPVSPDELTSKQLVDVDGGNCYCGHALMIW